MGWGGVVPTEAFLKKGRRIVDEASEANVPLRLIGGVTIRVQSEDFTDLAKRLSRLGPRKQEYTDLDFMSYLKLRDAVRKFESGGYRKRRTTLSSAATQRQMYFHPDGWFYVNVLFD